MERKSGKLELDKEYPSPDEASAIQTIEQMIIHKIEHNYEAGERPSRRDAHAKHHGCVKGEFIIENNLSEEMKFGIFQEPGKKFTACIRFSNGSGKPQPDSKGDGRGMAIKLLGVSKGKLLTDEKNTQDFCRKPIYNSISQARHQLNAVSRLEPTESEFSALFGDLN